MDPLSPNGKRYRVEIGGRWEIDDLEELVEAFRTSYAYFYWVSLDPANVDDATKHLIVRHFWSQRWELDKTASELYRRIPQASRLQLASMHYASPGWIEFAGWVAAISALALCASRWVKVADEGFKLYKVIQEYFDKRKLSPPPKNLKLDDFSAKDIDEARSLCFEYGKELGFSRKKVEDMIELTGNPISTLRLMTNLAVEARRILRLQSAGKLVLPPPLDDA